MPRGGDGTVSFVGFGKRENVWFNRGYVPPSEQPHRTEVQVRK